MLFVFFAPNIPHAQSQHIDTPQKECENTNMTEILVEIRVILNADHNELTDQIGGKSFQRLIIPFIRLLKGGNICFSDITCF